MSKFRAKVGAQKAPSTTSKKSSRPTATVTDDVRKAVDVYISCKAEMKKLEADMKSAASTVKDHVREQYVERGYTNQFTKSLDVPGENGSLVYTQSDRFSVPQDEDTLNILKKLIGKKYDDFFSTAETISIRKEILDDEKTLDKIATACEKAGLDVATIFERTEKITAVDGLDQKQFTIDRAKFDQFTSMVKQADAGLK
jgi:hypothetical protein